MKRLTLEQHNIGAGSPNKFRYLVKQTVDSTVPKVGAWMTEQEAANYCKNGMWAVTIKGRK